MTGLGWLLGEHPRHQIPEHNMEMIFDANQLIPDTGGLKVREQETLLKVITGAGINNVLRRAYDKTYADALWEDDLWEAKDATTIAPPAEGRP